MQVVLILIIIALIGAYAYLKVQERKDGGAVRERPRRERPTRETTRDDERSGLDLLGLDDDLTSGAARRGGREAVDEVDEVEVVEELVDIDDDEIVVVDVDENPLETVDTTSIDEEFEHLTSRLSDTLVAEEQALEELELEEEVLDEDALLEPETAIEEPVPTVDSLVEAPINEDVRSADDIMEASKATEVAPEGNAELQKLLQKVQLRLSSYE